MFLKSDTFSIANHMKLLCRRFFLNYNYYLSVMSFLSIFYSVFVVIVLVVVLGDWGGGGGVKFMFEDNYLAHLLCLQTYIF